MANLRRALRRRRAAELTVDPLIDVVDDFGTAVGESVGKVYNVNNSRAEKHLREYMSERVDMINATTRDQVEKALASDDPVGEVRKVFDNARKNRARMIAETEVVRTSNWSSIDAGKWVAELDFKTWQSQADGKVRHDHRRPLHGQVVGWNEDFVSGDGHRGKGPGLMTGGAEMNAFCRCSAVPSRVAQQRELGGYGDPVDLYESVRRPHVASLERAWRRVFDEQEAAVLAEIS